MNDTIIRSTDEDKHRQIDAALAVKELNADAAAVALEQLQRTPIDGGNTFEALMEAAKYCAIGQLSGALYAVGGRYRRSM